jgi:hypothetical protein
VKSSKMKGASAILSWVRRTFTWYFSAKIVLVVLVVAVSAASITASSTNYQAELGSAYNVSNNLLVGDKGFSKLSASTSATGTCPSANITFSGTPASANNAITAGDVVYDVQVNATASTPLVSCFTVTLTLSLSGSQTTKSLTIASGTSIAGGQTIECKLDIGTTSLPLSPFSFKLTVQ